MSSVVSDSQIGLTWYRRHIMAEIQLATGCGELYFSLLCTEMDWNIRIGK